MEETYTYDALLVQMLYRELPAADVAELSHLMEEDAELHHVYSGLWSAKAQLPKVQFNPSPASLRNIMQYSAKTALEARI